MQNQNQFQSLMALLPNGKVENDVRITETTVTGVCTVYLDRAADENAFFLRDIGVALIDNDLTSAVRLAVDQAYGAAVSHLAAVTPTATAQPATKTNPATSPSAAPVAQQVKKEPAPVSQAAPAVQDESEPPPVDLNSIVDFPGQNTEEAVKDPPAPRVMTGEQVGENIERIEFPENLFDKSGDQEPADKGGDGAEDDDTDPEYQKALDTEITIFGKLHDCNGWKAGRILAEQPAVIVDFCQRNSDSYDGPKYTGPRTDQKEALMKLYPDAALKLQKAA